MISGGLGQVQSLNQGIWSHKHTKTQKGLGKFRFSVLFIGEQECLHYYVD